MAGADLRTPKQPMATRPGAGNVSGGAARPPRVGAVLMSNDARRQADCQAPRTKLQPRLEGGPDEWGQRPQWRWLALRPPEAIDSAYRGPGDAIGGTSGRILSGWPSGARLTASLRNVKRAYISPLPALIHGKAETEAQKG